MHLSYIYIIHVSSCIIIHSSTYRTHVDPNRIVSQVTELVWKPAIPVGVELIPNHHATISPRAANNIEHKRLVSQTTIGTMNNPSQIRMDQSSTFQTIPTTTDITSREIWPPSCNCLADTCHPCHPTRCLQCRAQLRKILTSSASARSFGRDSKLNCYSFLTFQPADWKRPPILDCVLRFHNIVMGCHWHHNIVCIVIARCSIKHLQPWSEKRV